MRFSIRTLIWASVALALVLASVFAFLPTPIDAELAVVTEGPLRVTVQEDGKTRIKEKYIVSAPVSGRLSRIELREGDRVDCDDTLLAVIMPSDPAMLDSRARAEALARVQAAEAAVKRSSSNSAQAKIDYELDQAKFKRAQGLLETRAISQEEFDIANAQYLAAVQAMETARFDSDIAQFELAMAQAAASQVTSEDVDSMVEPFEINAPISGKVLRLFQESAMVVAVGTPLLELGDPLHLEMEIDVLSTDAVRIKPGAEVSVEYWGGESPLKGRVRTVEPAAFTKISSLGVEEQRVNIIVDFDEPPERIERLGDGYRVEARITIDQLDSTLLVPNSALFRQQRQWNVIRLVDGLAEFCPVNIGLQNETHTQILDGLATGDQIVVYPNDEIHQGTRLRTVEK